MGCPKMGLGLRGQPAESLPPARQGGADGQKSAHVEPRPFSISDQETDPWIALLPQSGKRVCAPATG